MFHGQRGTAAQHFFPIGCQAGKGLVAFVILRLPDHHLTFQILLGLFQFLNVLLQAGRGQLCFYMDILCVDSFPLPLLFFHCKAILFQLMGFLGQSLFFGFGLSGCQIAVGTVGNVLIGLNLGAQPLVFSILVGNFFQQLPAFLQPVGLLFHLGVAFDGLLHGMNVHRPLMAKHRIFTGTPWARPTRTVRFTTGQPSASIKIVGILVSFPPPLVGGFLYNENHSLGEWFERRL